MTQLLCACGHPYHYHTVIGCTEKLQCGCKLDKPDVEAQAADDIAVMKEALKNIFSQSQNVPADWAQSIIADTACIAHAALSKVKHDSSKA